MRMRLARARDGGRCPVSSDPLGPEQPDTRPHTWSMTFETLGCALICAVFLLAVVVACTWGWVQAVKGR